MRNDSSQRDRVFSAVQPRRLLEMAQKLISIPSRTGEAKAVLQDIASYEEMQESLALLKILALSRKSIEAGKARPFRANSPAVLKRDPAIMGIAEYREAHFKPYRIIYRVANQTVEVYCVLDGRRDMQALLQRRLLR